MIAILKFINQEENKMFEKQKLETRIELSVNEIDVENYQAKMQKITDDSQLSFEITLAESELILGSENKKIPALKISTRDSRFLNKYQDNQMGSYTINKEKQTGELIVPEEKIISFINEIDNAYIADTDKIDATDKNFKNMDKEKKSDNPKKKIRNNANFKINADNINIDEKITAQEIVMDNEFTRFELMLKSSLNVDTTYSDVRDILLDKIEEISEN